jgi:hypothetical protein
MRGADEVLWLTRGGAIDTRRRGGENRHGSIDDDTAAQKRHGPRGNTGMDSRTDIGRDRAEGRRNTEHTRDHGQDEHRECIGDDGRAYTTEEKGRMTMLDVLSRLR